MITGPTTPGAHAFVPGGGLPEPPVPPVPPRVEGLQFFVFESQHLPSMQVSPDWHLSADWHWHPSAPALHEPPPPGPVVPAGISHFPELHTPLAQSGSVVQVVFGRGPFDSQSPPVHLPLVHSFAWLQGEPGREPLGDEPPDDEPPEDEPPEDEPPEDPPPADASPDDGLFSHTPALQT